MAKSLGGQLLRPAKAIPRPARPIFRKPPAPLPENTLLIRKSKHKGPSLPSSYTRDASTLNHGQHIYLYNNIHTNQVVYSLTRHLNNAKALHQLSFLGKKTVPSRLRKDLWTPFCLATFPSPHTGLAAYRKLQEFRRLHETAYPLSLITETEGSKAGSLLPTKKRGKVLMDQKANSVADLAAVLLQQEEGPSEERVARAERRVRRAEELKRIGAAKGKGKKPVDVGEMMKGVEGVTVKWADIRDAEFAATWPEAVVHESLGKQRHTAAFPVLEQQQQQQQVAETATPAVAQA